MRLHRSAHRAQSPPSRRSPPQAGRPEKQAEHAREIEGRIGAASSKPIEDAIAGTQDLQTLSSNIQAGQASISATFTITSNQNTDLVNTQKALTQAEHNLPSDLQPPTLAIRDPSEATG